MEGEGGQVVVASGRALIDTRAPFKSVKEAVALFGERVLAGELYAKHLQEMQSEGGEQIHGHSNYRTLAAELEETKQSLEQALEENDAMEKTIEALKLELEQVKAHFKKCQTQEYKQKTAEVEMKEVKCVENGKEGRDVELQIEEGKYMSIEDVRMRNVKLASPHSLARAMVAGYENEKAVQKMKNKKQKKKMHPLVGWLTGKKSSSQACPPLKENVILSAYM